MKNKNIDKNTINESMIISYIIMLCALTFYEVKILSIL